MGALAGGPPVTGGAVRCRWQVRAWLHLFLAAFLYIVVVDAVSAQGVAPSDVRATLASDLSELTVGDVVTLSLVVAHPTDVVVVVPRLDREWGPFEVRDQTAVQTISTSDGTRTIAKQFQVTLFETGYFETPVLPIVVRRPDGSVEEIEPVSVHLTVLSVLPGPEDQLKDLRQPADFSTSFWDRPAVLVLAGLVLIGAFGLAGYYLLRRSRTPETSPAPEIDTRSAWEIAMQEFDQIARLDLPASGDLKEHYTLMAETLRACLGATFLSGSEAADTPDMSTEEIAVAVQRSSLDVGAARAIIGLLQEADLVKFANCTPPESRAYEAADQARTLVEAMRQTFRAGAPAAVSVRAQGAP